MRVQVGCFVLLSNHRIRVIRMDQKAAYLNAKMPGPPVEMMLTDILSEIDPRN